MKYIFYFLFYCTLNNSLFSQRNHLNFTFAPNISTNLSKSISSEASIYPKLGYYLNLNYDIKLDSNSVISGGLIFNSVGYKILNSPEELFYRSTTFHYAGINAKHLIRLNNRFKISYGIYVQRLLEVKSSIFNTSSERRYSWLGYGALIGFNYDFNHKIGFVLDLMTYLNKLESKSYPYTEVEEGRFLIALNFGLKIKIIR